MKNLENLFAFIKKSPTAFHTVAAVKAELIKHGYTELSEGAKFTLANGGKYFLTRNRSSIIAFRYSSDANGFMIVSSHSDSPAFRVKMTPEQTGAYTRLEVEKYGGMILYSWLDRPLSVAGRVILKNENTLTQALVNIEKDLAVIPSVAIHLNRGVNDSCKLNPAVDMLPLISKDGKSLMNEIKDALSVSEDNIISHDLFLYNREEGRVFGASNEFILSPRLDDLECVYASMTAFLSANDAKSIPVLAVFDNEEVGSETKQGAASTVLYDTLSRISNENYYEMLYNSMMVSADNAHAKHPNHPELSDPDNAPLLNSGVVVKWNASQRYATDALSASIFEEIAKRGGAKLTRYYNRADLPGGSTLGSISNTKVSIPTVDIGLPQLAMHSAAETAGAFDLSDMIKALTSFYSSVIKRAGDSISIS